MATQRWTAEMLDQLATSVTEVKESVQAQKDSIQAQKDTISGMQVNISGTQENISGMQLSISEMRESITDVKDSIEGLRVTSQALLQLAAQSQREMEAMKERQAESDERFNVLLEELRFLNRRQDEE